MGYQFEEQESLEQGVKRVALEQIDKALEEAASPDLDRHELVHQVRKRCKKLRGLLRLTRSGLGRTYQRENRCFRDAAGLLGEARDSHVLVETCDELREHSSELDEAQGFETLRNELIARRDGLFQEKIDFRFNLETFAFRLQQARRRVEKWKLKGNEKEVLRAGLSKTYQRACRAHNKIYQQPDAEHFHEWRKRVKYHWYHLRLIRPAWRPVLGAWRDEADQLGSWLGTDHDLAVLTEVLRQEPDLVKDFQRPAALFDLIDRRRSGLQREAKLLGQRLHAETPKQLKKRIIEYWRVWRDATSSKKEPMPTSA